MGKDHNDSTIRIRFIFANRDGVVLELKTNLGTKVKELKSMLLERWPAGVEKVEDEGLIRFICMGQGILNDNKTLEESHVPVFDDHPTPFNVSVRPQSFSTDATKKLKSVDLPVASPVNETACLCVIC